VLLGPQVGDALLVALDLAHFVVEMFLFELQEVGLLKELLLDALDVAVLAEGHAQIAAGVAGLLAVLQLLKVIRKRVLAVRVLAARALLFAVPVLQAPWTAVRHYALLYKQYFSPQS
jgi:hypothetical protein